MKKYALFLGIMLSFMACDKDSPVFNSLPDDPQTATQSDEVKVNLTIINSDVPETQTKAWCKTDFANDDVVFVFFNNVAAPKYLEMKYNSSTKEWTATQRNGLVLASDLNASGMMTAVYLPYGSQSTVISDGNSFKFDGPEYNGYFLMAQRVDYTFQGGVLSGTLNMVGPASLNYEVFVHFDVQDGIADHSYTMSQKKIKPILLTSISSSGYVNRRYGSFGGDMAGYMDGARLCFSGALDYGAAMNVTDYEFSVDDHTSSMVYTRVVKGKTVGESNAYIGLSSLTNSLYWRGYYYVDLGLSVKWATTNIIASGSQGYGDLYAWGETEHYYKDRNQSNGLVYDWNTGFEDGYTYSTYNTHVGNSLDNVSVLSAQYDAANAAWHGKWRMPTLDEMKELLNDCTWTWTTTGGKNGYTVTSKKAGYTGRSIFLRAAGYITGTTPSEVNTGGKYWTSDKGCYLQFYQDGASYYTNFSNLLYWGMSIRPVCP